MELSQETLNTYDSRLLALEDKAYSGVYSRVLAYINKFPNAGIADIREYAIECVDAIANIYGNAAGTCAANLYDELTEQTGQKYKAATVNSSDISSYIKKEAHYQAGKLVLGESLEFAQQMAMCVKDQVARCANQTMKENAKRDKIRYARVPMGGETCKFCIMLASKGFVYTSSKTAGEGNHYHSNCRCKVVPAFKGMTIQGYDTDKLYKQWQEYERIDKLSISTFDKKALKNAYYLGEERYQAAKKAIEKYTINETKLTKYALCTEKEPNKAAAFKNYLGYTDKDSEKVAALVYAYVGENLPTFKKATEWGNKYTSIMLMEGANDKIAKVKVGWIKRESENKIALTSIYVSE